MQVPVKPTIRIFFIFAYLSILLLSVGPFVILVSRLAEGRRWNDTDVQTSFLCVFVSVVICVMGLIRSTSSKSRFSLLSIKGFPRRYRAFWAACSLLALSCLFEAIGLLTSIIFLQSVRPDDLNLWISRTVDGLQLGMTLIVVLFFVCMTLLAKNNNP
jgi:hypothetical protein